MNDILVSLLIILLFHDLNHPTLQLFSLRTSTNRLHISDSYRDLLHPHLPYEDPILRNATRSIISMQAVSHVVKTRRRILRNNERLAKASSTENSATHTPSSDSVRDQGFTRSKVLILSPFRNSALEWTRTLLHLTGSTSKSNSKNQDYPPADNAQRFESEYDLSSGSVDKLTQISKEEIQKAGLLKVILSRRNFQGEYRRFFHSRDQIDWKG